MERKPRGRTLEPTSGTTTVNVADLAEVESVVRQLWEKAHSEHSYFRPKESCLYGDCVRAGVVANKLERLRESA